MAYLRLNPSNLNMDVLVGLMEEYKPSEEIKEVHEKVELLKKETQEFLDKYWSKKTNEELQKIFKNSDGERKLWQDYLENEYNPKLKLIIEKVEGLNKSMSS